MKLPGYELKICHHFPGLSYVDANTGTLIFFTDHSSIYYAVHRIVHVYVVGN
jgi:hypothetical protein